MITRGAKGSSIEIADEPQLDIPIARGSAGRPDRRRRCVPRWFPAGLAWEVSPERCAQLGSLLASYAIEVIGTQEYRFGDTFLARFEDAYGAQPLLVAPHLCHLRL